MIRSTLPVLAGIGFASMASIRLADSMLPRLAEEFGRSPADAAMVITGFALAYGVMQLIWGPLADRLGKLRVIAGASLGAALGSLGCALSGGLDALMLARLVTGGFCAAIIPLAIAWVGDNVPYAARQATLARLATGTLSGLMIGSAVGGLAADTLGWRTAFLRPAVVFTVLGLWLARMLARGAPGASAASDAAAALAPAAPGGSPRPPRPGLLRGFAAVLAVPHARWIIAAALAEGALMFGALAFVPSYLHVRHDVPLAVAGLAGAAVGLGGLLYTLRAAWMIARLGERGLAGAGGLLVAAGWLALLVLPGRWLETLACTVAGFGFYMIHNTLQTQASQMAPASRGTAVGLFAVAIFVGQSLGVAAAAALIEHIGYEPIIVAAAVGLALLGAAIARGLGRRQATGA